VSGAPEERVHHPKHYNSHPSGIEAIVLCEHLGFNVGNAVKYMVRQGIKPNASTHEDLAKARFYLARAAAMPWSFGMVGTFDNVLFVKNTMKRIVQATPTTVLGVVLQAWLDAHEQELGGLAYHGEAVPTTEAMVRSNQRLDRRLLEAFDNATEGAYDPDMKRSTHTIE
jgi:hypothetical protein